MRINESRFRNCYCCCCPRTPKLFRRSSNFQLLLCHSNLERPCRQLSNLATAHRYNFDLTYVKGDILKTHRHLHPTKSYIKARNFRPPIDLTYSQSRVTVENHNIFDSPSHIGSCDAYLRESTSIVFYITLIKYANYQI